MVAFASYLNIYLLGRLVSPVHPQWRCRAVTRAHGSALARRDTCDARKRAAPFIFRSPSGPGRPYYSPPRPFPLLGALLRYAPTPRLLAAAAAAAGGGGGVRDIACLRRRCTYAYKHVSDKLS
jgi:hypothetical protein